MSLKSSSDSRFHQNIVNVHVLLNFCKSVFLRSIELSNVRENVKAYVNKGKKNVKGFLL